MRILAIAAAALLIAGAAYAQDTTGASKSHMGNPQTVPETKGGQTSTMGASKSHEGNPQAVPASEGTKGAATNDKGEMPKGGKNKD